VCTERHIHRNDERLIWACVALALAFGGCHPGNPATSSSRIEITTTAPLPTELIRPARRRPEPGPAPDFLGRPNQEILEAISQARPVGGRGTTGVSLSMYLNLEGDDDAAFKPRTRSGQRWTGEIAAYRLGRVLGFDTIPPAITRRIPAPLLRAIVGDEPETLARIEQEAVTDGEGMITGALVYWVPVIHTAEVERLEELDRWTRWLRQGAAIPPERLELTRQLSDLIVFDYLTGNWDRWSSGNMLYGPDRRTLLLMDNNAAFNTEFSQHLEERLSAPLSQVERFSATLYHRLVGLRAEDIEAELASDPTGSDLLTAQQIAAVLTRRDDVLRRIESLSDRHGHDAVLCFP
jgi:hypothetical protein